MRFLLYVLVAAAAVGLLLSLAAHVSSFTNSAGPLGSYTWTLHAGALVLAIPAVLEARRLMRDAERREKWKALLRGCPPWTKYALYVFYFYALVNFGIFLATPDKNGDGMMPPAVVRGFSGHWMAFYATALAILYSAAKTRADADKAAAAERNSASQLHQSKTNATRRNSRTRRGQKR